MGYADPLYRSAALQVSQRALASGSSVHTVITDVKNKIRMHTRAYELRENAMTISYR